MNLPDLLGILIGMVGTIGAGTLGVIAALQYRKMGGGAVQLKINRRYKELSDGLEKTLIQRDDELSKCLEKVNEFLKSEEARTAAWEAEKASWRKERMILEQKIDDLRHEVRELTEEIRSTKGGTETTQTVETSVTSSSTRRRHEPKQDPAEGDQQQRSPSIPTIRPER